MTETQPTIFIVEDDTTLNEAYMTLLESAGYRAVSAINGQEALDQLSKVETEPDVIFLDLRMPVMDGIEFLKKYQPVEKHPAVKIVVFSNYDMEKEVERAYELGADRYVLKAWASPKEFLHIVEDTLKAEKPSSR